jgi:hypothetical protein
MKKALFVSIMCALFLAAHNAKVIRICKDNAGKRKYKLALRKCELSILRGYPDNGKQLDETAAMITRSFIKKMIRTGENIPLMQSMLADIATNSGCDGCDIKQTVSVTILSEYEKAVERGENTIGFLEREYIERELKKRIGIKENESAAFHDVTYKPIQKAYQAASKCEYDKGHIGYNQNSVVYFEDIAKDSETGIEETIYKQVANPLLYVTNEVTGENRKTAETDTLLLYYRESKQFENVPIFIFIERLESTLTAKQREILGYRLKNHGLDAIATRLGKDKSTIREHLAAIAKKAEKLGLYIAANTHNESVYNDLETMQAAMKADIERIAAETKEQKKARETAAKAAYNEYIEKRKAIKAAKEKAAKAEKEKTTELSEKQAAKLQAMRKAERLQAEKAAKAAEKKARETAAKAAKAAENDLKAAILEMCEKVKQKESRESRERLTKAHIAYMKKLAKYYETEKASREYCEFIESLTMYA